jgi:hypothetical protein
MKLDCNGESIAPIQDSIRSPSDILPVFRQTSVSTWITGDMGVLTPTKIRA